MEPTKMLRRVAVIGAGPHYRSKYHPVLEQLQGTPAEVQIAALVDLEDQRDVVAGYFAKGKKLVPDRLVFLGCEYRNAVPARVLDGLGREWLRDVEGALICTEPKVHKAYALWATANGLDVFVDKPLTASVGASSHRQEFGELLSQQRRYGTRFVVSCERRMHPGYSLALRTLREVVNSHQVPVTGIHISFSGGKWIMPSEYLTIENHPYKYGYGILMHSGYHFVDLLAQVLAVNEEFGFLDRDTVRIKAMTASPKQAMGFVGEDGYRQWFPAGSQSHFFRPEYSLGLDACGEVEVSAIGQTFSKAGQLTCTFSLRLSDVSASLRGSDAPLADSYLGGGRMRQEYVEMHVGHMASVRIYSDSCPPQDPDTSENFVLQLIRNPAFATGPAVVTYRARDLVDEGTAHEALNTSARRQQLKAFLAGESGNSALETHQLTSWLLDMLSGATETQ